MSSALFKEYVLDCLYQDETKSETEGTMNSDIQARVAEIIGKICRTEYRNVTIVDIYKELGIFGTLAAAKYILELIKLRLIEQPEHVMPVECLPCFG